MTSDCNLKFLPETYTPLELERIKEFRIQICELELTEDLAEDAHLLRWLRARNLDVKKAYNMLKQSLEWRKEHKLNGILEREDVPKEIQELTSYANLGLDKEGFPILLVPMGRQDYCWLLEKYGPEDCFHYQLINCEKLMNHLRITSKEQGRHVTQFVQIIDLEGYSYRQWMSKLCRDFMVRTQTMVDANYPEVLRYCMVINAPKIFHILFNFLKPFIPKHTLEKVDIYGPEPDKWKKVIAEKFPLENIPPHWGGTMKGSDEFCSKDTIWVQGQVPISFFTQDNTTSDNDTSLTKAIINARDTLKISVIATKPNSLISWRIRSQSHDIGFKILRDDGRELVSHRRIQSQKEILEGNEKCAIPGNYTVVFDNTYSYTRSKTIFYDVSIIEEDFEDCCSEGSEEPMMDALDDVNEVMKIESVDGSRHFGTSSTETVASK